MKIRPTTLSLSLRIVAAALLSAAPLFAEDLARPGMWEMTTDMGISKGGTPHVVKRCYTAEELAGVNARSASLMTNPSKAAADQKCTVKDVKYTGNKGSWTTVCANDTTVHSDMTFHGDSFEAVMTMGGDRPMTIHMAAKRVGDCK